MVNFEDFLQENIDFETDDDPSTFEEFLEPEEYTGQKKHDKSECILGVTRYLASRTFDLGPYVTLTCKRGDIKKIKAKSRVDDEEEEVPIKRRGPYRTKNYKWQLFVHDGRHNHAIGVYHHVHAQAARLMEEQLKQTEQFGKSHIPPCNMLQFFREQNLNCAVSAQTIYNVLAKMEKKRMQGCNTVDEVLCLSAKRSYTVFYRNCEGSDILSDIVVCTPDIDSNNEDVAICANNG
ncbi:hypothetical protein M9H77_02622 [Catharanthus roseus]|uniref:Uncharacterized protein n=1 Tax=Catharanthus roseus TaxID=4058 RepID=A0ACC0C8V8_CATRO|nr:hypothetical protein M9H77_02622 [Catharanthus roseus]